MIMDELLEFADATSVALAISTAVLGDVIDLGLTPLTSDIGNGQDMWLVITCDTSIVAAGAGTITYTLVSDALATLGAGVVANCTSHYAKTVVTAVSPAGLNLAGATITTVALPMDTYEQFLGVLVTVAGNLTSAGKVNAFLTRDPSKWVALADASN
jgi:hypothetical protein